MDPSPTPVPVPDAVLPAPADSRDASSVEGGAVPGDDHLSAHTSVVADEPSAAPSADELSGLIASSGGGSIGLIAALIAVVGGTAGFKLWTKISEQKHEQAMKKLDLDHTNSSLSAAVAGLEERVAVLEKAAL
jgi:hypothetical protein